MPELVFPKWYQPHAELVFPEWFQSHDWLFPFIKEAKKKGGNMHAAIFNWMVKQSLVKIVVNFSGGNDSGCIDELVLIDRDGIWLYEYNHSAMHSEKLQPLTDHAWNILTNEYGSFAGDFSVSGNITYDLKARTVIMSKSEQHWGDTVSYEVMA